MGGLFTAGAHIRFRASSTAIQRHLADSPVLQQTKPVRFSPRHRVLPVAEKLDIQEDKGWDAAQADAAYYPAEQAPWYSPRIDVSGRRWELPWDQDQFHAEVIVDDAAGLVYITVSRSESWLLTREATADTLLIYMSISPADPHTRTGGYTEIARQLRSEILHGELPAGGQLPAISELARRFGTTAVTARRALRWLEEQGLVRVEHGVGSFVADWSHGYDLLALPSFASERQDHAQHPETVLLGRYRGFRYAPAAEALGLEPEAEVVALARVRKLGGVPVAFQRSYLAGELADVVQQYRPTQSLYKLLRDETGRLPVAAEERLRAVPLPRDAARELDLADGALGWRSERLTHDAADLPLVYDEAFFPAERMELRITRRAGQSAVDLKIF